MPTRDDTTSGIYQIRCLANGKVYIGSAVHIAKRWGDHRNDLARGVHHSCRLQRAWLKYGAAQFVFEVLEIVSNKANLIRIEQGYLDRIRPADPTVGFNNSPTAGSNLGIRLSPQARAKLSAAHKGKTLTVEHRAKQSAALKGRSRPPRSAEWRAKLSAAHKGKTHSPEARARMSAAHKDRGLRPRRDHAAAGAGRHAEDGDQARKSESGLTSRRKLAPEHRAKIAATNRGRVLSPENRAKLLGRTISPQNRAAVAAANKKRAWTPEARAKQSASLKAAYARRSRSQSTSQQATFWSDI
jgi:group I intron endonuclease